MLKTATAVENMLA